MPIYDLSEVASNYSRLTGVLAGFAFVYLTILIGPQVVRAGRQEQQALTTVKLTHVMTLAILGLITSTALHIIRLGEAEYSTKTIIIASIVDTLMAGSTLIFFAGLFMTLSIYINSVLKEQDIKRRINRDLNLGWGLVVILIVILNYINAETVWEFEKIVLPVKIGIAVWIVLPVAIFWITSNQVRKPGISLMYRAILGFIAVPCLVFSFVINMTPTEFETFWLDISPTAVFILITITVGTIGLVAGFLAPRVEDEGKDNSEVDGS